MTITLAIGVRRMARRNAIIRAQRAGWQPKETRIAVQGFGNAGYHVSRLLARDGYKIVAISDSKGGIYSDAGFDVEEIYARKQAALEGAIHPGNVDQVRAWAIAEVVNGPVEGSVDDRLHDRKITVLPDVLVNAGGVIVSYFEWAQNRQGYSWSLEKVRERLAQLIVTAFDGVWALHADEGLTLRDAAYVKAVRRIAAAVEAQGSRAFFDPSR